MNWLYVFIGGGLGAVMRYGIGVMCKPMAKSFPWATLASNMIACVVIGVLFAYQVRDNKSIWLLLAVGLCGGLSTFSAFSLESVELFQQGNYRYALLNIGLSLVGCLACTALAAKLFGHAS
jgi:CrcB protein